MQENTQEFLASERHLAARPVRDSLTSEGPENNQSVNRIVDRIRQEIIGEAAPSIKISELEIDYWSFIFQVTWQSAGMQRGVFVKIPRCPWDPKTIAGSLSNPDAQAMAVTEFTNLSKIHEFLSRRPLDPRFGAIKPIAYWPEWNAIITEKVCGSDLYLLLRQCLLAKSGTRTAGLEKLLDMMTALGEWLADFQIYFGAIEPRAANSGEYAEDFARYWKAIGPGSLRKGKLRSIQRSLTQVSIRGELNFCPHMEGFEIRNVLVEDKTNRLFVLDPGTILIKPCCENVVECLTSLRILYWGTARFFLGKTVPPAIRDAFLIGYRSRLPVPTNWMLFFEVKEIVHSWSAACLALNRKKLPSLLKRILKAVYVDPFYMRSLDRLIPQINNPTSIPTNK